MINLNLSGKASTKSIAVEILFLYDKSCGLKNIFRHIIPPVLN